MRILIAILIALVVGCKEKEPTPLDEGYPMYPSGERIKLYDTQKFGGTFDVKFNGHLWNHYPYLTLNIYKEAQEKFGKDSVLSVHFWMYQNLLNIDPCIKESLNLMIPLKKGDYEIQNLEIPIEYQSFESWECDYGRGLEMRKEPISWVKITEYNAATSTIAGQFHLYYQEKHPDQAYHPIYPDWVEIEGSFSRDYFGKAKL